VDALRGLALFGVLLVNLQTEFRVSIFGFYASFHSHGGRLNVATDYAIAFLLESKSFTIFSFLFGVGMAIFFDRARCLGRKRACALLLRRLAVLAVFGVLHMLIWNGDILLLYALAGLLTFPALLVGPRVSLGLALAVALPCLVGAPLPGFPSQATMLRLGAAATSVYGSAGLREIVVFRCQETYLYILPLLLGSLPRVLALILTGMASYRLGLVVDRPRHAKRYLAVALVGLAIGCCARSLELLAVTSQPLARFASTFASVPFALGYVALFFWASADQQRRPLVNVFAPIGRMALSNYLFQSVLLGFVFFGYGLGLFGRLGSAPVAVGGIVLYSVQVLVSRAWLERFRFGPLEWLWRSLTWGRAQPFRRNPSSLAAARRS